MWPGKTDACAPCLPWEESMTILVTGATGYIGRHLVLRLVERGDRPRCLVRPGARIDMLPQGNVEILQGDITNPASLPGAVQGVDAVVHLASVVANVKESATVNYARINDRGTADLVQAASAAGVRQFIYLSGVNTVPGAPGSYIRTRWNAEQHVKNSGIPYSILEPSILFGDHAAFFTALADLLRVAPIVPVPGNGTLRFQPVWVEDVATCLLLLLEEGGKNETIAIGGPDFYSYDALLDLIATTTRKRRLKVHVPLPLMKLGAASMQAVLPRPPVTTAALDLFLDDNVATLNAIPARFGFQPKSLAQEMADHGI
jgi:NADH dehydrogenase